jgi:hypothetical protein
VTKVPVSAFVPAATPVVGSPYQKLISVENAFMDPNGVIHLVSNSERGVVRWDTVSQGFLSTLPLRGAPLYSSYAPEVDRLALVYGDGSLSDLFPVNDPMEQIFGYVSVQNRPFSLVAMDELTMLNIRAADTTADLRITLGPLGELKNLSSWSYWGKALTWHSNSRRLYTISGYIHGESVDYFEVSASGILPGITAGTATNVVPPLRFSVDGTLLLTANGRILNVNLQQVGTLANPVADGVWLSDNLFTIRVRPSGTELQKWTRITYKETDSISLPGIPLRIFRLDDDRLAVVTTVNGYLVFSVVTADLAVESQVVNTTTITGLPVITKEPQSQVVLVGQAVTFTVAASGTPVPQLYQWYRNGVIIEGATGSAYTIARVTYADRGSYTVTASNFLGSTTSAAATLYVDHVRSPGVGADFNQDGRPDLIWSNSVTGERALWLMSGTNFIAASTLGIFPLEWTVAATGDFNADGKPDIVWSNSVTGERALWLMDGTMFLGASTLGIFPLEWTVAATGDFNADGKPDLVWSNSVTGERALWLMDGTMFLGSSTLGIFPLEWTVAATGDFNADGKPDLVWSNSVTGERALWLMNGTMFLGSSTLGVFPLEWTVEGVGDYNGDGLADLIWSNCITGERAFWLMNGTQFLSSWSLGSFPLEWTVSN